jgi:hypothetical protein
MQNSLHGERLNASYNLGQCVEVERQHEAQVHMRQCSPQRFVVMILSEGCTLASQTRVDVAQQARHACTWNSREGEMIHVLCPVPRCSRSRQCDSAPLSSAPPGLVEPARTATTEAQ